MLVLSVIDDLLMPPEMPASQRLDRLARLYDLMDDTSRRGIVALLLYQKR